MNPYSFAGMPEEIQLLASDKQMTISKDIYDFDLDKMLRAACKITNADYELTIYGSRKRECIEAKSLLCYFLRRYTKLTVVKIGMFLKMDHSNVVHHVKKFKNLIEVNDHIIAGYLDNFKKANSELIGKYQNRL
jgi:chromosomal replication initiation ATPase DnaA